MALQRVPNLEVFTPAMQAGAGVVATINAAGESCAIIGHVMLENGTTSQPRTLSSSGGKIYLRIGTPITFANIGTTIDIGIQDVSATTGLEDNTFDVKTTLTGGTDTITASTFRQCVMTTGSKTINHGQIVAVVIEMTARGGASDSVILSTIAAAVGGAAAFPYATADTGGGVVKVVGAMPFVFLEFDDGSTGWILGASTPLNFGRTSVNFNNGSATDEYIASFTPAFTCEIDAVGMDISDLDATNDTGGFNIYSDPYGTPVLMAAISWDPDQTNSAASNFGVLVQEITPTTLVAGTTYGIAVTPTSANNITIGYIDLGSGNQIIKKMSVFGSTLKLAGRANLTGAFTEVQTYYWPFVYFRISKLDDGVSAGTAARRSFQSDWSVG